MSESFEFAPLMKEAEISLLIDNVRGGSNSSLGTLLEIFRPSLTQMAKVDLSVQMQRRMSLSDLVQETMLTACGKFDEFRGDSPAELQAWLIRIFKSRLVDGIRRHQVAESRRQDQEDPRVSIREIADSELSPSGLMVVQEDAAMLLSAIQQLPEEAQQLIHMRYVENQTFEAIAEQLNVSVATVWRRFRESTQNLHQSLRQ